MAPHGLQGDVDVETPLAVQQLDRLHDPKCSASGTLASQLCAQPLTSMAGAASSPLFFLTGAWGAILAAKRSFRRR
jgi:hypothetical protein